MIWVDIHMINKNDSEVINVTFLYLHNNQPNCECVDNINRIIILQKSLHQWFIDNDIEYQLRQYYPYYGQYKLVEIGFPDVESAILFVLQWKSLT
jgi:hypothetical protein